MVKEFYDLEVWKAGKDLVIRIYDLTKDFPRQERYGLVDQLRRAANSICANIAEGFSRYHAKDKIKFYYNARGSLSECKSHILIAKELKYISSDVADKLLEGFDSVGRMLNSMIASLSRYIKPRRPST